MTCSECSNQIPEDKTVCPFCGAPAEFDSSSASKVFTATSTPVPDSSAKVDEGQSTLRLWEPVMLSCLTLPLLGPLLGSILVGLNWHRLKRRNQANIAWGFFPGWLLLSNTLPMPANAMLMSFIVYGLWFFVLGLPQIRFFKEHVPANYLKRGWLIPVMLGVGFNVGLFLLTLH